MILESLYALAALANIGCFALEVAKTVYWFVSRRNAQRGAREGASDAPERND